MHQAKAFRLGRRAALMALGGAWLVPAGAASRPPAALSRPALKVLRPERAVLLAVARAGRNLVVVGERGLIIRSADDGRSWTQSPVPVSCTLTCVCFANEREGWAGGGAGVVLRTTDGGLSWKRVLQAEDPADWPLPLLDLQRTASGSLLAVGAAGLAFESQDAGASWRPLMDRMPNPDAFSLYGALARAGGQERFIFGEQGLLLRSPGESEPWALQAPLADGSLFAGLALREGPLLLMGLRGKVWRSAAQGEPWNPVTMPLDASLLAGHQLADGRVLLAGAAGQLLLSADQGEHFEVLNPPARFPFSGLTSAANGALVLVGMRGLQRIDLSEARPTKSPVPSSAARVSAAVKS